MARLPIACAGGLLLALLGGCASEPLATWQGARLYASGSAALEAGETRRAIRDLERAATLVPHASEVHNHLGAAYAAEGRDAEALAAFERAVDLDCDNAAAQRNLRAARAAASAAAP
jgi:Flp pilus assembly protein TadD